MSHTHESSSSHHHHDDHHIHTSSCSHTKTIPVTLLSGFLGSGKTTLLKHILHTQQTHKIACIVNDMAPLNIDASLIATSTLSLTQTKPELVKMQNGCICCTLRQDLVRELAQLAQSNQFDYILIESTGISEPMHVAESFVFSELHGLVHLDTCVTLIDIPNFLRDLLQGEDIATRFQNQEECDDTNPSHVSQLLIDQVEFANVILLNKIDLATANDLERARAMVQKLNPHAKVYETQQSKVPLEHILNTRLFNLDRAEITVGWLESLRQDGKDMQSELDEYGVASFIYRRRKPFDPRKLHALCYTPEGYFTKSHERHIARSKGFIWLAGSSRYSDVCYEWEQSGSHFVIRPSGHFFASMDEQQWNEEVPDNLKEQIKQDWEGQYGDRRQELVFIGYKDGMNEEQVVRLLDECLVSDEDFAKGVEHWSGMFNETMPSEFFVEDDEMVDDEEEGEVEYIVEESSDEEDLNEENGHHHKRRRTDEMDDE